MPDLKIIDPHVHMSSRTTDDYEAMAAAGVVAVIEPAFWVGQPRTNIGTFIDYYSSLVGWERFRAAQFGIQHYCTIGLNSKEANQAKLADEVMEILPRFACKERVVAIGEIGFDDMSSNEEKYFKLQCALAKELDMLVMVHTPHRNKKEGTSRSMDLCLDMGLEPNKVIITTTKKPLRKCWIVAFGPLSPFTPKPKWAMSVWFKWCANMVLTASLSIPVPTGELVTPWLCQRQHALC